MMSPRQWKLPIITKWWVRDRVEHVVEDAQTAEALKPYYRLFCKRPCFHDDYLDSFNRLNVHLVITDGRGVARIKNAVMFDDVAYEVDCIIFATGFEVGTIMRAAPVIKSAVLTV